LQDFLSSLDEEPSSVCVVGASEGSGMSLKGSQILVEEANYPVGLTVVKKKGGSKNTFSFKK
jgi:hypothetical protein